MSQVPDFSMEHSAVNVPEPAAMADWYCTHLGMKVVRKGGRNGMCFLADASGRVVMEIYLNPVAPVPDYANQDPLILHLAFIVEDVKGTRDKLCAAGASVHTDVEVTEVGDEMVMMRDPWGLAIQFIKRKDAMLVL